MVKSFFLKFWKFLLLWILWAVGLAASGTGSMCWSKCRGGGRREEGGGRLHSISWRSHAAQFAPAPLSDTSRQQSPLSVHWHLVRDLWEDYSSSLYTHSQCLRIANIINHTDQKMEYLFINWFSEFYSNISIKQGWIQKVFSTVLFYAEL